MARYQGQVGVFRASVPLGVPVETTPQPKNFIDELVFQKLKTLGVPPSAVCDDATFLRRATVDIAGRLPTPEETEQFLADTIADKRERLDRHAAGEHRLRRLLRQQVDRRSCATSGATRPMPAVRGSSTTGFATACTPTCRTTSSCGSCSPPRGEIGQNPPVAWYREVNDMNEQVEDTAQLFLGLRIQCARCHHHPFEKWSQQDYYGFAAFFSRIGRKPGAQFGEDRIVLQPRRGLGQEPQDRRRSCRPPAWAPSRPRCRSKTIRGRRWSTGWPSQGQSVLRPGAGQPLLEALLQPRPGRSGRRHAGHQSGHEPRTARRAGPALHRQRLRPEGPGAHDLQFADVPAFVAAERVQRRRQAELLALLSQAAAGRSAARRDRRGDRLEDQLRRRAAERPSRATARHRFQLVLPDRLRQARELQRLRMRTFERSQPGPEPAPAQ